MHSSQGEKIIKREHNQTTGRPIAIQKKAQGRCPTKSPKPWTMYKPRPPPWKIVDIPEFRFFMYLGVAPFLLKN